jgi:hypothetical protein
MQSGNGIWAMKVNFLKTRDSTLTLADITEVVRPEAIIHPTKIRNWRMARRENISPTGSPTKAFSLLKPTRKILFSCISHFIQFTLPFRLQKAILKNTKQSGKN